MFYNQRNMLRKDSCSMEVAPFGNSAEMNFNLNESSSSSSQQIEEEEDEAALIRDYCKICFRAETFPSNNEIERGLVLLGIAHTIYEQSDYRIINSRILHPEKYIYPLYSMESFRHLLNEMGPVFDASDEARREEALAIEQYTRCRSMKLRKGAYKSRYEYVSIDTNERVDYEDFEARYMQYLDKEKKRPLEQMESDMEEEEEEEDKENETANSLNQAQARSAAHTTLCLPNKTVSIQSHKVYEAMQSPRLVNSNSSDSRMYFTLDL